MPVLVVLLAYLLGSLPIAVFVGRLRGVDPRAQGDGNAGWWNMRALVGKRLALTVLAGDVAKGAAAAGLAATLTDGWLWLYAAVLAAEVGHAFPVFARFKGGKAILTFVGGVAVICPWAVALALAIGAVAGLLRRRASTAYQVAFAVYPIVQLFFTPITHVAATGVLMTFIGVRFLSGTSARATTSPVEPSRQ